MSNIEELKKIMAQLRSPEGGCPWDLEQNYATIAPHTIEEAYEVADAIERGDMEDLKGELGDLLFQVVFHSQMAAEEGAFDFEDVVCAIRDKMIKRHPHVFGGSVDINTAGEQEVSWEKQKEEERRAQADKEGVVISVLDGVAVTLPAMTRAVKLQKRAAKVGFDWPRVESVFDKVYEELDELKHAVKEGSNIEEELGDLLFIVTNLCRKLHLDPEVALKKCNRKFEKRFHYIEAQLQQAQRNINEATLEQMDELWEEAKGKGE